MKHQHQHNQRGTLPPLALCADDQVLSDALAKTEGEIATFGAKLRRAAARDARTHQSRHDDVQFMQWQDDGGRG